MESWLGPSQMYRRILDRKRLADVIEDRQFLFLSRFGAIHYFKRENAYLVTGFEEADRIFRQDDLFPNIKQTHLDPYDHLLSTSPERHDVTSALIRGCLTKKVFSDATAWVSDMSVRLFDSLPLRRSFDWYLSFAMPAAYFSACRIFGFDDSNSADFFRRGGGNLGAESFYQGFKEWCLKELRSLPPDGDARLLYTFRSKVAEGLFTEDEAVELILVMFHGALKTTASTLCILPMKLITRKWGIGPLDLQDERMLSKYIEEAIRLSPVLPRLVRSVAADTSVAGVIMRQGAQVHLDVRAANRDGRRFNEPQKASLHANHQRHLSFGAGMHQCIGMHMARHNINAILAPLVGRLDTVRHVGSKWVTETSDVYFHQARYMLCRRDVGFVQKEVTMKKK